jgi:argininosuccinate synthase
MSDRVVLAYSGDFDTTAAIPALARSHRAEIVTVTLDLGGGRDLEEVRDRALGAGAVRAHVIDARDEFVADFVLPSLHAGAVADSGDPMGPALARPLVARKLAEVAAIEAARDVIDRSCLDENLWGRRGSAFRLTTAPDHAPDAPGSLQITFDSGVPSGVNGVPMGATELIESVSIIAGHYGIGRIATTDGCIEAPAATVLHAARAALESSVLPPELSGAKRERARIYAQLIAEDRWATPEREALDALNAEVGRDVSGAVRITLSRGTLHVIDVSALAAVVRR